MWQSLKIGAAMVAIVGLVMSGLAVAQAVDEPEVDQARQNRTEQVIAEALAPLVENGTLTQEQAEAVVGELAPIAARIRFQERTQDLVKKLGRLAGEIAEVSGISGESLREQLEAGMTLAEIAEATGSTGEQLLERVTEHIAAHLAVQVTAGKLDQAQADEAVATTKQTLSELIEVEHPFGTVLQERRQRAGRVAALDAASEVLGMSIDELRGQLENGDSLAQIAETRGVGEDEVVDAILSPLAERIAQAVERGRLTDEEAAETLDRAAERVAEAIHKVPGS